MKFAILTPVDTKITGEVHLNLYLRHKWLANPIHGSPMVNCNSMNTGMVALTYRFK